MDPNIVDGEVPTVEHAVPLLVLGIAIVPVTPVGAGLSPPEVTSVAPSPIPVGPTAVPELASSGDVAPRVGVVGIVPTCAVAALQMRNVGSSTAINANLIVTSLLKYVISRRALSASEASSFPPAAAGFGFEQ